MFGKRNVSGSSGRCPCKWALHRQWSSRIPAQNGVKSVSSYARLSRYARCSLDACRTHGGYALTERGRGRESGGSWLSTGDWVSRARRRGSTGCHSGAKWCCVARRVAIDRLNSPSSGGNAKTPRLIARNSPAKQSSTTYHFINLSSLCESPPPSS